MTKDNIKKQIKKYITSAFGMILCVSLGLVATHPDELDKVVLLEDKNSGYWKYLSPYAAQTYRILKTADIDGNTGNLFVLRNRFYLHTLAYAINDNGTLFLSGINGDRDEYIRLTPDNYKLCKGEYKFEIRNINLGDGVRYYIEAYTSDGNKNVLLRSPDTQFEYSPADYESIAVVLVIPAGYDIDEVTIDPSIVDRTGDTQQGKQVVSYSLNDDTYNVMINYYENSKLTKKDWRLFERTISNTLSGYQWLTIVNQDGNGTQFINNGCQRTGNIDTFGRVVSE